MQWKELMATSTERPRPVFASRRTAQLGIALLAAATAALAVVEPGGMMLMLLALLAVLAALRFDLFLCSMVLLLPWYPFINWKLPVRDAVVPAHLLLFAGVWLQQVRGGVALKDWFWKGWIRKGILGFAAIAVLSLLISESRATLGPYKAVAKLLSYVAMFSSVAAWANTRERIELVVKLLMTSTIGVALFGFYQAFSDGFTALYFRLYPIEEDVFDSTGGWTGRITSFLFHFNSLAGYLNAVIPFALGVAVLSKRRRVRWLGFVCLASALAALYLTSSRGGLIAFGAVAFLALCCLTPRRTTALVLAAAILAAALIAWPLTPKPKESVQAERLTTVDDFTRDSRVALWGAAAVIFLEHPILGAGFGTYRFTFHRFIPGINEDLDSHNLYLQTLAETGVIGFVVFFVTLGAFARVGWRLLHHGDPLWRILGAGASGAIAATLVHGMVDYIFIASPQFGNLFWLILGLAMAACEVSTQESRAAQSAAGGL
jgi:putative inorganic carbon (HCO3(-)) transporter